MTHEQRAAQFYAHLWPHRATVLRTARFLVPSAADAEDLAQETFMRAFRNLEKFDPAGNPSGWLTTILRHVQIDRSRVRSSALLTDAHTLEPGALPAPESPREQDPGDVAALLEQFSDQSLIDALHTLPEEMRWALLLIDVEQMDHEDAAAVLEVPVGTVKSRMFRARRLLRARLVSGGARDGSSARHTEEKAGPRTGWRST